jgi:hypothetical protein
MKKTVIGIMAACLIALPAMAQSERPEPPVVEPPVDAPETPVEPDVEAVRDGRDGRILNPVEINRPERIELQSVSEGERPQLDLSDVMESFRQAREAFLEEQREIASALRGATEDEREALREALKEAREQWMEQTRELRAEIRERVAELRERLPNREEVVDAARERGGRPGTD